MEDIASNETAFKVVVHIALDGAALLVENTNHNHEKQKAAEKFVSEKTKEDLANYTPPILRGCLFVYAVDLFGGKKFSKSAYSAWLEIQ